jgi:hypothetical protein
MQSKFKIGDTVTYNDGMTKPFTSTIIHIKSYMMMDSNTLYVYKLQGKNIYLSEKFLNHDNNNN